MRAERERYGENGDTLIEILMTLIVLSIAVVAIIIAFATGISASADHKNLAANDVLLRQAAEAAFYQIQQQPTPLYTSCAQVSDYSAVDYGSLPTGYSVQMTSVQYWDTTVSPATFDGTCAVDSPQLISLKLTNTVTSSSATTTFVVDNLGGAPVTPMSCCSVNPNTEVQGSVNQILTLTGTAFASGATVTFTSTVTGLSTGITVNSATFVNSTQFTLNVSVSPTATVGSYTITVTNPGGASKTSGPIFTVTQSTLTGLHVSSMVTNLGDNPPDPHDTTWDARVTVYVENGNNQLMSGVTVNGSWSVSTNQYTTSCVTDQTGSCEVADGLIDQFPPAPGGTPSSVTWTIFTSGSTAGLVKTGYTYAPLTNAVNSATTTAP